MIFEFMKGTDNTYKGEREWLIFVHNVERN